MQPAAGGLRRNGAPGRPPGYPVVALMTDILQHGMVHENQMEWSVLDQIQASVILTDLHGVITGWNRHAELLYGWRRDEAIGANLIELSLATHEASTAREVTARLATGQSWEGELPMRRKDGSTYPKSGRLRAL